MLAQVLIAVTLCLLSLAAACGHCRVGDNVREIRRSWRAEAKVPELQGSPGAAAPLVVKPLPDHPYMAEHGASCMHADPFTTNTYPWAGPLGIDPEVQSRAMGMIGGECPTVNFDRHGRVIAVCVRDRKPWLLLMNPDSLEIMARHALPRRETPILRVRKMMEDTSGGAYFYLDQEDRAVVGTADGTIDIIDVIDDEDGPRFHVEKRIDLTHVLELPSGKRDKLTAVMPDFAGNYWFTGRFGTVGVARRDGRVRTRRLAHEEIQNSFSVGPDGTYVISDHALYRLEVDPEGRPAIVWRETYDRGSRRKVGQINRGSGTTPTLLGEHYIAIADNAEPRMNVRVYLRDREASQRLVCSVPVFESGASATENTMIGYGRSLVVENNAGYDLFRTMRGGKTSAPGLTRIDVRKDGSGCDVVWTSDEISQTTVPKLSTVTGLVYTYTKMKNAPDDIDAYYFTAIDFATGRTRFRVLAGTGMRFDNNWAAITLSPDGSAYVGVLNGLLRVRDRGLPASAGLPATRIVD
jgi:hypothetical protein